MIGKANVSTAPPGALSDVVCARNVIGTCAS
jgi:hypothetical protein